jgi:hypothetical protein
MTEGQIEKTIEDIEERLWLRTLRRALTRSVTSLWKGVRATYGSGGLLGSSVFLLLLLSFVMLPGFIFLLLLALFPETDPLSVTAPIFTASPLVMYFLHALYVFSEQIKKPKIVRIWKFFVEAYARKNGRLSKNTENLASRISLLYQLNDKHKVEEGYSLDDGPRVLPVRQAARLLHIYEQEQRRILALNKNIVEICYRRDDLSAHLEALKEQGESRRDGEDTLEKLSETKEKMSGNKAQLEKSIRNLESILKSAEDERDARARHRYIDKAIEAANLTEPQEIMERDMLKKLEERITTEIESYLQIEKKLRQDFDKVMR